jgi:hypothetical protein
MRIKFTDPCPDGQSIGKSLLNKSKVKYTTQKGGSIVCPYQGTVSKVNSNSVVLKHSINGEDWESELSGFIPTVSANQQIHEGRQIGYTINGTFTFDVNPNVNVEDLLSFGVNSSMIQGKSSKEDNSGSKKYNSSDDPLKGILKMFLSPVTFAQGALNLDEQEIQEKTTLIKEEINRMRKLF